MKRMFSIFLWCVVALLGAWGYVTLALHRGEHVSSVHVLLAALSTYAIGYRFYSKWVAATVLTLNDRRATPCELHDDGKDFVRTNKWIVFGHHFAAISGPGPLVGPVLAAQFGYLPGMLWILVGVVLGGAVQDFVILFCSLRRDARSLGQMVKDELGPLAGAVALVAVLAIMIILLAVLGLVVVKALAESPWGVFTVSATIPIAMMMGGYLRYVRVGKVLEASIFGVILLLGAVWGGQFVHGSPELAKAFTFKAEPLAWGIILYGLAASILPVWLLLAPRDYLSTFMKLGTIFALVAGVFLVLPELKMPALSPFIDGSGPVVRGKLFPFCFITIACGAISGFHTLIASGTTPKILTREGYARGVGYGAMLLESLVAIMALIAACSLEPGVYLSMNIKGAGADAAAVALDTVAKVKAAGFEVSAAEMSDLAHRIGETTLFGRTGGAATLAVGMAKIFSKAFSDRWLDLWYHFAIMFEALFILTTLDAGTRVGRYLLQDFLGVVAKPLGDTRNLPANALASVLVVGGWGWFLIQGVRDPLGGINSLWPLFGIANQLLASIALCLGTTVLLKMHLKPAAGKPRPWLALVTFIPLCWLLAVTVTAGWQKIFHASPRIGFLAMARDLEAKRPALEDALSKAAGEPSLAAAKKALATNKTLHFNQMMDAVVAGLFLALVAVLVMICLGTWLGLLLRKIEPRLREEPATLLPEFAVNEVGGKGGLLGFLALGLALLRELSGEAQTERNRAAAIVCCEEHGRVRLRRTQLSTPLDSLEKQGRGSTESRPTGEVTGEAFGETALPVDAYLQTVKDRYDSGEIRRCC